MLILESNLRTCFGKALKNRREKLGLSVATVANQTKMHKNLIYRYERGEVIPSVFSAYVLISALGWSIDSWVSDAQSLFSRKSEKANDRTK